MVTPVFSSTPNDACVAPNWDGSITVKAGTTGFGAGTLYNFTWQSNPGTAGIVVTNGTNQASVAPVAPSVLSLSTYATPGSDQIGTGDYVVRVLNQTNGCTTDATVTVTQNTIPVAVTATALPRTHCVVLDGSANITGVTVGGGAGVVGEFSYNWTGLGGPYVVSNPTNLDVGDYIVTATKNSIATSRTAFGCSSAPVTVQVLNQQITPTVNFTSLPSTSCDTNFDGQITVLAATASTQPAVSGSNYNFDWTANPGGAVVVTDGLNLASPYTTLAGDKIGAGSYTIRVTKLANQCFMEASFTELSAPAVVDIMKVSKLDQLICNPDGQITVNDVSVNSVVDANHANFSFDWYQTSTATPTILSGVNEDLLDKVKFSTIGKGVYFVTATRVAGVSQGSGCISSPVRIDIDDLHVNPTIAAATINPDVNCAGGAGAGTIQINEPTPMNFTYSWFTGDDTSGAPVLTTTGVNGEIAQALQEGNYTVQVRDNASNCLSLSRYTIQNNPTTVSFNTAGFTAPAITTCNLATGIPVNGSATITSILENNVAQALGNYNFVWTNAVGAVLQNSNATVLNNLPPGSYFVTATSIVSNCVADFGFTVEDKTIGTTTVTLATFEQPERCVNPKNGSLTALASGTGATYSYEWFPGDQRPSPAGVPVGNAAILSNIAVAPPQTNVIFTVRAINNSNNCWAVDAFTVPVIINPIILSASTSPLTFCNVDNGEAFATIVNDNKFDYNFLWSNGPVAKPTPDFTGNDYAGLAAGTYTVVAVDKLDNTCSSQTISVVVTNEQIIPVVTARVLQDLTMCDPAKPDGVASADVGGDLIHYSFDWFTGTTTTGVSFHTGSEVSRLAAADYSVLAKENTTGCSASATVKVKENFAIVPDPTILKVSDITSCKKDNGELSVSVGGVTKDYIFDWANGASAPPPKDFTGEIYKNLSVGKYTVIATSRITGCISKPTTELIKKDQIFPKIDFLIQNASCTEENGFITILLQDDLSIDSVTWLQNGVVKAVGPNLQNALSGTYQVSIITTEGCEVIQDVFLPADIQPFNGVSRTNDGKNDFFVIDCIENFPNNHVEVYNRAGTKVYEANGYNNLDIIFEGRSNQGISIMGTNLPAGTYYYIISKGDGSNRLAGYLELVD